MTALAGGVGASKLLGGIIQVASQDELTVIVNTGDDIILHGLHISPDLDIVTYTLANIVDEEKGWGVKADTLHCLEMLRKYEDETWFNLGDRDIATHLHRTSLLKKGFKLSEVTAKISRNLGLKVRIIPMTDDAFETWVETDVGSMHFEEYLVKRGSKDPVLGIKFKGVETASPAQGVLEAILTSNVVIVCPSNPVVSIGPILSVKGVREALRKSTAKKIAVSPIIKGAPVKGPADKLMKAMGLEVSAFSVANQYRDFIDTFVIDHADETERNRIEELGLKVIITNTVMRSVEDKTNLARKILEGEN